MSKFDQQMREVERSLAKLTGNKAQAAQFRKGLEKKIQQAAVNKLLKDQKKPGYPQKKDPSTTVLSRLFRSQS